MIGPVQHVNPDPDSGRHGSETPKHEYVKPAPPVYQVQTKVSVPAHVERSHGSIPAGTQ